MNNDCEIIIPTYYPGKIICSLIKSIPKKYNIKIIDNSRSKFFLRKKDLKSKIAGKKTKLRNLGSIE